MKIVTVQFNFPDKPDYKKLLDVFEFSVKQYMPKVDFVKICTPPPVNKTGRAENYNYNDFKLRKWCEILESTDENVIFADCDMMALQSAEHAFDIPFDIAYTQRTVINRIPMNGGIVMVRPNEKSRKFFREWYNINHKMLHNVALHRRYSKKWAGMNQAAFGYLFSNCRNLAKLHEYKTRRWNSVDCDWLFIDKNTVFVHYKSKLRKIVLAGHAGYGKYKKAADLWYAMYREMIKENPVVDKKKIRKHPVRKKRRKSA